MVDLAQSLRRCGLFRGFDAARLDALAAAARELTLAAGAAVFHEGDPGDAMYVVLDGAVQIYTRDRDGREVVLVRLEAGEHFGEQSLLPGTTGRRSAGARATEAIRLARVPKGDFQAALAEDDALRERLVAIGGEQVRRNLQILSPLARGLGLEAGASPRRAPAGGGGLFSPGGDAHAPYFVARRGMVTQHAGTFAGHDCITTLFHLTDGRVLAAYRVVGQDLYALERLGAEALETLVWRDADGRSRELRIGADGAVVGLTARGVFADAHALHLFVLDGGRVGAPERARFATAGVLGLAVTAVTDDIVCHCVNVSGSGAPTRCPRGDGTAAGCASPSSASRWARSPDGCSTSGRPASRCGSRARAAPT